MFPMMHIIALFGVTINLGMEREESSSFTKGWIGKESFLVNGVQRNKSKPGTTGGAGITGCTLQVVRALRSHFSERQCTGEHGNSNHLQNGGSRVKLFISQSPNRLY